MDRTRKLRRELSYGVARLRVLEKSVDPAQDDPSAKALATQIREQAGVCLDLLDQYQLSVPGRMWTYAETRCQPLRDDLKRTELQFRDASGEFKRRADKRTYSDVAFDWGWADVYEGQDLVAGGESDSEDEPVGTHERAPMVLSCRFIEAHNQQDLDGLIDLVDETVEFKRAFDPPLTGKEAVRRQYERDWADHKGEVVHIAEMFESGARVALEVHVDSGPPSDLLYNGVFVHHWNAEGRLARLQLYVDEATPESDSS